MRTMLDFAASCHATPDALQRAQQLGVRRAALHVTREVRGEIRTATGDMRLSGVGARGARVGARYDVKGATNPTALIRATGPLHLVEHPSEPHEIRPRRRRGTKALALAGGGFAARVKHPGVRQPRRPFARGVSKAAPQSPVIFNAEIEKAMRRTFS